MRWWAALVMAVALIAPHAHAQTRQARAAVAEALYAYSGTTSAAERALDERLEAQQASIAALRERIGSSRRASTQLRTQLAEAQESYVTELARRDRAYARELEVFRGAVTDIAASPEGLAALDHFNTGNELGALAALDALARARTDARRARNDIESAAEGRRIAQLALEARSRGRIDTQAVLARFVAITALDPGVHTDWRDLDRLYQAAGDLSAARAAAVRAEETATDDWQRGDALGDQSRIALAQGNFDEATRIAERALSLRRGLASAGDPASRYYLAEALRNVGAVLVTRGQFSEARVYFQEAYLLARDLAAESPRSIVLQREVAASLERVADVHMALRDYEAARARYEYEMVVAEWLVRAAPERADLRRLISVVHLKLGDVAHAQNDLAGARTRYEEGLRIRRELAALDPTSASAQRDLYAGMIKLGDVLTAQRDHAAARAQFEESLRIAQALAAADPSSANLQRDVWSSLWRLQRFPDSGVTWATVVGAMEDMRARGVLADADIQYLEQARGFAARESE